MAKRARTLLPQKKKKKKPNGSSLGRINMTFIWNIVSREFAFSQQPKDGGHLPKKIQAYTGTHTATGYTLGGLNPNHSPFAPTVNWNKRTKQCYICCLNQKESRRELKRIKRQILFHKGWSGNFFNACPQTGSLLYATIVRHHLHSKSINSPHSHTQNGDAHGRHLGKPGRMAAENGSQN